MDTEVTSEIPNSATSAYAIASTTISNNVFPFRDLVTDFRTEHGEDYPKKVGKLSEDSRTNSTETISPFKNLAFKILWGSLEKALRAGLVCEKIFRVTETLLANRKEDSKIADYLGGKNRARTGKIGVSFPDTEKISTATKL